MSWCGQSGVAGSHRRLFTRGNSPSPQPISWSLLAAGVALLLVGAAIYWFDRPHETVYAFRYFGLTSERSPAGMRGVLGGFGQNLPSLLHVVAFSLLTFAVLPHRTRSLARVVASFWVAVNFAFEVGQAFGTNISAALPSGFALAPWLDNIGPYFLNGTFDSADVAFLVFGGTVAYFVTSRCT
jgi:hypothetical protein